jgi:hypothetical protein
VTDTHSSTWLDALSEFLLRRVEASARRRISLDIGTLASLWNWPPEQTEAIVCQAASEAGLAVGIVDAATLDIMTLEEALSLLEADVTSGEDSRWPLSEVMK